MPEMDAQKKHRFAVLIAARDESQVIGELLNSINEQNYPKELLDIYVVADNCTDDTVGVSREHGANVFERFDKNKIGKGYALNYAFNKINEKLGIDYYDGYLVFDADNVLDENYIKEINNVFASGYKIVTSYRNSKNYGYNWISAGYSLWFLRESKYLNGARMICKTSCAISGTGFLVSSDIIKNDNGWRYNLLTEDIEFSVDKIIQGNVIGYCENAILYDEQPISFKTSWTQRMRWTKGFYQVMQNYGLKLLRGCFTGKKFQCFDMLMTIAPATLLTISMFILNLWFLAYGIRFVNYEIVDNALISIWMSIRNIYLSLLFFGAITLVTEWKQIYCSTPKKILYLFTFPIFMFTYIPISIAAIFTKVTWTPIEHSFSKKVIEIRR
jgi:Glycosyltransferases, probably involved in cell wall biogenesis